MAPTASRKAIRQITAAFPRMPPSKKSDSGTFRTPVTSRGATNPDNGSRRNSSRVPPTRPRSRIGPTPTDSSLIGIDATIAQSKCPASCTATPTTSPMKHQRTMIISKSSPLIRLAPEQSLWNRLYVAKPSMRRAAIGQACRLLTIRVAPPSSGAPQEPKQLQSVARQLSAAATGPERKQVHDDGVELGDDQRA